MSQYPFSSVTRALRGRRFEYRFPRPAPPLSSPRSDAPHKGKAIFRPADQNNMKATLYGGDAPTTNPGARSTGRKAAPGECAKGRWNKNMFEYPPPHERRPYDPLPPYLTSRANLSPTPFTLHPTPYTLHPTLCTLHPVHYTLHPTPYTLHPTPDYT